MFPFGDLPGNLTAFCRVLRHDHDFRIGPGEITDAGRALNAIDVEDHQRVRDAWRAILSSTPETAARFDSAFDAFFFPGPPGTPQPDQPVRADRHERPGRGDGNGARRTPQGAASPDLDLEDDTGAAALVVGDDGESPDEQPAHWARARYSPLAPHGIEPVELRPVAAPWRDAARALVRRLEIGLSRRWRTARRGRRFDLRRTWRTSLQTGGEAVSARWLRRIRRSPRLVILLDGSRSMHGTHQAALDLAVALTSVARRVDVFAFSTTLLPLTGQARQAGGGRRVRAALSRDVWGGGTSIGDSLRTFLRHHGERQVSAATLVVIVSDGLDVGDTGILRECMRELHRRAAGVVWLNPLLDTPGYEPSSRGMKTARPFITTFAGIPADPQALVSLAHRLRLRR